MGSLYESIISGLSESIEDVQREKKKLTKHVVSIVPVKEYNSKQIQNIRKKTGMSQKVFAGYMGVSVKTIEAWETGTNHPSGAASRLLNMMEMNDKLTIEFPFVKMGEE